MECPNCGYVYENEETTKEQVAIGRFFMMQNDLVVVRGVGHGWGSREERRDIYGCPKCRIAFIADHPTF